MQVHLKTNMNDVHHKKLYRSSKSQLKPLLNHKVDELFLAWISSTAQNDLLENFKTANQYTDLETRTTKSKNEKKSSATPQKSRRISQEKSKKSTSSEIPPEQSHISKSENTCVSSRQVKVSLKHDLKVPQFYFPRGMAGVEKNGIDYDNIARTFQDLIITRYELVKLEPVCRACGCPLYWKAPLFYHAIKKKSDIVSVKEIIEAWKSIVASNHDNASRFVSLIAKPGNDYLEFDDFLPLVCDIVDSHPGLLFLKEAPEFHSRYVNTVMARIFYTVNSSWSGKITINELRKSNFLQVVGSLEEEDDINAITDYFSYEHFYVIYCKFWELDTDHDLIIDCSDLAHHADGVLSSRLLDRVLSGAVTRWKTDQTAGKKCMSYLDFIWFIISEEDKKTNTSIIYWFRCMDLDGDGVISLYEMEYFYEEQMQKLELLDIEALPFEDCACQMLDMIKPAKPDCISLSDLKKSQMADLFFDTFLNVEKYLNHEQKDPFANFFNEQENIAKSKKTDWDRYAAEEYEVLVAEEQSNEKKSDFVEDCSLTEYKDDDCDSKMNNFSLFE